MMPALLGLLGMMMALAGLGGGSSDESSDDEKSSDSNDTASAAAKVDDPITPPVAPADPEEDGEEEEENTDGHGLTDHEDSDGTESGDHSDHEDTDTSSDTDDTGSEEETDESTGGDHSGHEDEGGTDHTGDGTTDPEDPDDTSSHEDHTENEETDSDDESTDHSDHSGIIPQPGVAASQVEIDDYLHQIFTQDETHVHDSSSSMSAEHMAAMNLAPRDESTNVAIADGDWADPEIWSLGKVPQDDEKVLIPEGVTVEYSTVSDAEVFTVRIDGTLEFATDTDSQLIFDTMIVSPTGHLSIGSEDNPVDPDVNVDLIVANNGPIDVEWDPMMMSRGLISHGKASIHGAEKDSHDKVSEDPMEGDTHVSFDEVPEGWQVGDKIVIAGTHYDGYKWDNAVDGKRFYESEDEERVITKIEDGNVYFEEPLEHDHDSPRDDLATSVANYTRNVSIETDDGEMAEVYERGHVMFMHSDDVDVRYAEFTNLGRTDKSVESFDVSDIDDMEFDSNVQGRYSLHLHRTGTEDQDDPAMVVGNAVYGSPGWGFVHHDSNAILDNNASFDTFGAGYVAETGNETGEWTDNIAIFAQGVSWARPKITSELSEDQFDTGRGGDGFWFQGRLVDATDNVAASVNTGFVYFHRDGDDRMINPDGSHFEYSDVFHGGNPSADDTPILLFDNNEVFAAREGLHIVKANPNQGHDIWSELTDFTAWSVQTGAHLEYTSHYILTNFDLIGKEDTLFSDAQTGIELSNNTSEIVIKDAEIADFVTGIDLFKKFVRPDWTEDQHNFSVIGGTFTNVDTDIDNYDPDLDLVTNEDDLPKNDTDVILDGPLTYKEGYPDPEARIVEFTGTKIDGLGETEFPGGTDSFTMNRADVVRVLENDGYWTTDDGQAYFLVNVYFTDRLTGDIMFKTEPVYLDENVKLGNEFSGYGDAKDNGVQDITTEHGMTLAGDIILGKAFVAIPDSQANSSDEDQGDMDMPDADHSAMDHSAMPAAAAAPSDPETLFNDTVFQAMIDDIHGTPTEENLFTDSDIEDATSETDTDPVQEDDVTSQPLVDADTETTSDQEEADAIWADLTEGQNVPSETDFNDADNEDEDESQDSLVAA